MNLYILATSDVHGYIMPTDYIENSDRQSLGLAKAASVINAIRAAHEHVVYIDNGDLIQGSALAQYLGLHHRAQGPRAMISCLNAMHCDAAIIGNHEFNYGLDYLQAGIKAAAFPVLAANVVDVEGKPFAMPYTIVERAGVKIAILGLLTPFVPKWEKPEHIRGLRFLDPVACARMWVPKLRTMADVVIVSYHGGFDEDPFTGEVIGLQKGENCGQDLLQIEGIDALLTGHQHRELAGVVNGVPLVMPGWRATAVGLVHLILKKECGRWTINAHEATLLKSGHVEANADIVQKIEALHESVEEWLDIPIGSVEGDMRIQDPLKARCGVHPYVDFINRLQMKTAGVDISCTSIFNDESRGLPEEITVRNIVNNYVYANTLAVLEVSGADLRAALERCARFFAVNERGELIISEDFSKPFIQYYNYDVYSGIDYSFDIRRPVGERVVLLRYRGKNIKDEDVLQIVMNNYRAAGGGGYPMYSVDKVLRDVQVDMTDLIVDYINCHPVLKAHHSEHFKVIY